MLKTNAIPGAACAGHESCGAKKKDYRTREDLIIGEILVEAREMNRVKASSSQE